MEEEGKTINHITVEAGGEYVQNKHVEYQIGKVEAGGIGIQIIGSSRSSTKANKAGGFKVTSSVFTYRWTKQHSERLTDFYQYLVKLRAIDQDTVHEEFENLFSGVPTDIIVKWLAPKSALKFLMETLKKRKYIEPAGKIWMITESHFKDKKEIMFENLRKEHNPKGLEKTINLIADVLDPQKKVHQLDMIDEDQADELWYGIKEKVRSY